MIYILDYDPYLCAMAHADPHLDSAIVTGYRALCFAHYKKPSFQTFQCAGWLREYIPRGNMMIEIFDWVLESSYNYIWISRFLFAALSEYHSRFNKLHPLNNKILMINNVLPGTAFDERVNNDDSPIWYPLIKMDQECIVYIESQMVVNAGGKLILFNTDKQNKFYVEIASSYRNFYMKKFKNHLKYGNNSIPPAWTSN